MPTALPRKTVVIALSIITLIGIFLRIRALSDYKFYPDSYQPLIVAENIRTQGSVVGELGKGGMLYPDYELDEADVSLAHKYREFLFHDLERAAAFMSLLAGMAAIPIAYLFLVAALRSQLTGLLGSLLLALSYNGAVWGGFILSDTTGAFFLFLTLWLYFRNIDKDRDLADWRDLLTGAAFALAVLARYEYAALAIPFAAHFMMRSPHPLSRRLARAVTIAAAACLALAAAYFFLSPFSISATISSEQFTYLIDATNRFDLSGLRGFVISDPLITLLAAVGGIVAVQQKRHRRLLAFSLICFILLGYFYYHTNPAIQRYFVHLVPFILVPASIGFAQLIESARKILPHIDFKLKYAAIAIACLALLFQFRLSSIGLHSLNRGLWFTPGYEELAAKAIRPFLPPDDMIIVSFPEPYFLATGHVTQSIAEDPPFVYISDAFDGSKVTIIEDEGMRRIFPAFSEFIAKRLKKSIIREIPFKAIYRYADEIGTVDRPLRLYSIPLGELKSLIGSYATTTS